MAMLVFGFSTSAHTKDLYFMLVPESNDMAGQTANQDEGLGTYLHDIERGLQTGLLQNQFFLIDRTIIYSQCTKKWCGESNLNTVLEKIRVLTPGVQIAVLYSIFDKKALRLRVLDPFSFEVLQFVELPLIESLNAASAATLGRDAAQLLADKLQNHQIQSQYRISLKGFEFEELKGLSTHILSNTANTELVLTASDQYYSLFDAYFPLVDSDYELKSFLFASQINQLMRRYFEDIEVDITMVIEQSDEQKMHFAISRQQSPYIPSLLSFLSILLVIILTASWWLRRQYLQYSLEEHAQARNAFAWLKTYKKAAFPLYLLKSRYESHASYWERCEKDSESLSSKAKVYLDAGDTNTAKLFISKALHTNTANPLANRLVESIEKSEQSKQKLTNDEQWIRNKIAKALNNYRQQKPLKALKQLYQAQAFAKQERPLKKQYKAIGKLIKKVCRDFYQSTNALVLNIASDEMSYVLCNKATIQIGRMPTKSDENWISSQDSVFCINHKSISRLGQHCQIQVKDGQFSLLDLDSKNGTYLNGDKLKAHLMYKLKGKDRILLGGKSASNAVSLLCKVSASQALLCLDFDSSALQLFEKHELNKIWPDNALAIRTSLVCLQKQVFVLIHKPTGQIRMLDNDSYKQLKDSSKLIPLCIIELGENASITPMTEVLGKKDVLEVDGESFEGSVPLSLPCTIRYNEHVINLSHYVNTNVPISQPSIVVAPSNAK